MAFHSFFRSNKDGSSSPICVKSRSQSREHRLPEIERHWADFFLHKFLDFIQRWDWLQNCFSAHPLQHDCLSKEAIRRRGLCEPLLTGSLILAEPSAKCSSGLAGQSSALRPRPTGLHPSFLGGVPCRNSASTYHILKASDPFQN